MMRERVQRCRARTRWARRKPLLAVMLGFILLAVAGAAAADPEMEREYGVKAAYLYNFAKFVSWPETAFSSAREPIQICVLGRDDFGGSLEAVVSGKRVHGRYVVVRKLQGGGPGDGEAANCNILFVSESEQGREPSIFAAVAGRSVVTVGEVDGFAKNGGMINCIARGTKLKFQLNRKVAEDGNISVSSRLVKLAELVD